MDQNQSVDNDLQKAIDNITSTTNVDPVFSDPVAAPSSIPEGDTGEISEPVGPFPEAKVEMVPPTPEPIAPLESMDIPEFNNPNLIPSANIPAPEAPSVAPTIQTEPTPTPIGQTPTTEPATAPAITPEPTPSIQEPTPTPSETPSETPTEAPVIEKTEIEPIPDGLNTDQIKKAALRDLVPILDKVSMGAPKKFKIYQDVFQDLKDYSILEPAYKTARESPDETERAEALLYLVESIDDM